MAKRKLRAVDRRDFLRGAVGTAALAAQVPNAAAQQAQNGGTAAAANAAPVAEARVIDRPGSDFMMDIFKSIGFDYVFANPGGSFGGLHESVINYCGNKDPEFITCMHEESSIAMAHGYAKIEGKPVLTMAHGTVGLQHAAMALYNAWCDRVPVYLVIGNSLDAAHRGGEVGWDHSVQDAAAMVRDYTKWDDTPVSLQHFAESAVRAYKICMTPPTLPVVLVADTELQDLQIPADEHPRIPKLALSKPPAGDAEAVAEAAKMLVAAENPVIVTGRSARTPAGIKLLVELAETLQAGVVDQHLRMNFPSRHPLYQAWRDRAALADADVILGLETADFYGMIQGRVRNTAKPLEDPDDQLRRRLPEEQLPGFPALSRSGPLDCRRCRGHSARLNRSLQEADHQRPPDCDASPRHKTRGSQPSGHGPAARAGLLRMGRQPD